MTRRRSLMTALAVALALVVVLQVAFAADPAMILQLKGQPGQENHYAGTFGFAANLQMTDPQSGASVFTLAPRFTGTTLSTQRVEAVAPNGDLTLNGTLDAFTFDFELADLSGQLKLAGPQGGPARFPRLPAVPISAVMSPRGALVSLAGLDKLPLPSLPAGPSGQMLDLKAALPKLIKMFSLPVFPDHPVAPGGSWTTTLTVDPAAILNTLGLKLPPAVVGEMAKGRVSIPLTSTFTGMESVDGVQTAVIRTNAPYQLQMPVGPPGGASRATISEHGRTTTTINLDPAAGRIVRQEATFEFNMSVGASGRSFMQMMMQGKAGSHLARGGAVAAEKR